MPGLPFLAAAATTASTASWALCVTVRPSSPAAASSRRPSSALLPSRRTTSGRPTLVVVAPGEHAARDLVAARDAAEDVDEQRPHAVVGGDDVERGGDALGAGAAADVAEVGGRAAGGADHVERAHDQAGAVAQHADVAVEREVGDAGLARRPLAVVFVGPLGGQVGLPVQRVVVDGDLGVERDEPGGVADDGQRD